MKTYSIIASLMFSLPHISHADSGGIYLDTTRVIFDSSELSKTVKLHNNTANSWLLRAWISNYDLEDGKKSKSFIITPPLYKIGTEESFQFKIESLNKNLPNDRESVFHINVMAIPPITKEEQNKNNAIQFAINTKIKLFYRPHGININSKVFNAYKTLKTSRSKDTISISNPSPYYVTMDDVIVNGKKVSSVNDFMIAPYSTLTIPEKNAKTLSYTTINDYGGKTLATDVKF